MNGNIYSYACLPPPPPPPPLPSIQSQVSGHMEMHWSYWSSGSTSFVQDFSRPPPPIRGSYISNHSMPRPHRYGSPESPRHYSSRPRFGSNHFRSTSQPPWQRNNNMRRYKRPRPDSESSDSAKPMKKKRKPQTQNVSKKVWTKVDAERALQMEKDYNKKIKNRSLIIKFPDVELSKDIVIKFHPEIKNVHFQQPSTPRYCFVTLKPTVDPEKVIEDLKQQKFGDGYLTVEYKKERDDDQVVQPEDIDPFTLYVGNLAQEVTKEDMVKMYPKSRRIDIGYAMKMKYTRYAFVGFKNMEDCREAFKRTHSMEIRSKSLIVRFRRVHGTAGMPGETKSQNPPRSERPAVPNGSRSEIVLDDFESDKAESSSAPVTLGTIKEEPRCEEEEKEEEEEEEEDVDVKPNLRENYVSPFMPGSLDAAFAQIKPKVKQENVQVKTEDKKKYTNCNDQTGGANKIITFKEEPIFLQDSEDDNLYDVGFEECIYRNESDEDDYDYDYDENDEYAPEQVTNFDNLYSSMVNRVNFFNSLKESK